jgi:hypothetical protein
MILPTKHISPRNSLLGIGALLLKNLDSPKSITMLWHDVSKEDGVRTFDRFVLALDLLYMIGAIELNEGLLLKCHS